MLYLHPTQSRDNSYYDRHKIGNFTSDRSDSLKQNEKVVSQTENKNYCFFLTILCGFVLWTQRDIIHSNEHGRCRHKIESFSMLLFVLIFFLLFFSFNVRARHPIVLRQQFQCSTFTISSFFLSCIDNHINTSSYWVKTKCQTNKLIMFIWCSRVVDWDLHRWYLTIFEAHRPSCIRQVFFLSPPCSVIVKLHCNSEDMRR